MRALSFKILLSATVFAGLIGLSAPAFAAEPTVSVSGGVASGRIFGDQGFTLTRKPVTEASVTVCKDGTCLDVWTAQSLSGRSQDHETDVAVWHDFKSDRFTFRVKGAYFELPGKEVWDGQLTVTYQANDTCSVAGSYERMVGGFDEEVFKIEVPCSFTLGNKWTASVAPAIATSKAFPGTTGGLKLGASRELGNGFTLSISAKGYARDQDRKDGVVAVQIVKTF
jgi:hypothetical protein